MKRVGVIVVITLVWVIPAHAVSIALWNFNDGIPGTSGGLQEFTVDRGQGMMISDFVSGNIGNLSGTQVNAQGGDPAGRALRLQGGKQTVNNGRHLTWFLSTAGFDSLQVSFATRKTSTGFNRNQFQYSLDSGTTWVSFGSLYDPETSFGTRSYDLSGVSEINNHSNTGFRIIFNGARSFSGNNRFDNLLVSGNVTPPAPIPEPSTLGLVAFGLTGLWLARFLPRRHRDGR